MEYDTASKSVSEHNEGNSNRRIDEGNSSPENGWSGSSHISGDSHSKAKAQRSAREDLRGGSEFHRRLFPRGTLSRDSAFHSWPGSRRSGERSGQRGKRIRGGGRRRLYG